MNYLSWSACFCVLGLFVFLWPVQTSAQEAKMVKNPAVTVAKSCLNGRWRSQSCVNSVTSSNSILLIDYANKLDTEGKDEASAKVRQDCAASSVEWSGEYPASAFQNALLQCADAIDDVAKETKVMPILSLYEVMVGTALCIADDTRCKILTEKLEQLK